MKHNTTQRPLPEDPMRRGINNICTHLFILAVDQRQLEAVLGGVDGEHARPALPVQAVHAVATDTRHVDGQVQGPDDAVVAVDGEGGEFVYACLK